MWPWSVATSVHRASLARCSRASQVQARCASLPMPAESSPSLSDRSLQASFERHVSETWRWKLACFVSVSCSRPAAVNSTGSAPAAVGRSMLLARCSKGIWTLYIPYLYWGRTIYIPCGGCWRACGRVSSLIREWSVVLQCLTVACRLSVYKLSALILIESLVNDF